jgi:hypothetical protein
MRAHFRLPSAIPVGKSTTGIPQRHPGLHGESFLHRFFWLKFCYLRSASLVARSVNSSESRGTLSMNGPIAHPSPVGMERDSVTDSIWM